MTVVGTASQTLADFVASLRPADVPSHVMRAARRQVTDAVGVAMAAAARGAAGPLIDMVHSWAGAREASIIGFDFSATTAAAALANGTLIHAMEFDDTHVESVVALSAAIVPAALAVAEEVGASGDAFLTAVIAGYETAARVGAAAPGRFAVRGLDTTGVCGPFGAAAAAANLWGLTPASTADALGIAGSQSAGLSAHLTDGVETERFHAGWAAHAGIIAADLARRGFAGPSTVFEGPHGIYEALLHGEESDRDRLILGLGQTWETTRIAIKPYPASPFVHAFMDAGINAPVKWADVEEIMCSVTPPAIGLIAEPRAQRLRPATMLAAQHSLPFALASAIVGGREGLDLFDEEARNDRRVLTLAERIHHEADPTLPFPASLGGRLRIHTRGGRTLEIDELINRGHPDKPLDDEEVDAKFLRNVRTRVDTRAARKLLTMLRTVDQLATIDLLTSLLRVG